MTKLPPTDYVIREDETPATFAEMKPPGYWSASSGRFVEVRMVSDEEFRERSFLFDPDFALALERARASLAMKRARALGEIQ